MNEELSQRFYKLLNIGFFCLCLSLYTPTIHAQNEEIAGRVIRVSGIVNAINVAGTRPLARGDDFYVGDTITTGPAGFTQIRLTDSAIISLKADTAFEITEYTYQSDSGAADAATMTLLQGGFRTITGNIGNVNKEAYRVETPFATIGIRGTDHQALITPDGLIVGVFQGSTFVFNDGGSIELGVGQSFDFAFIASAILAPLGLPGTPDEYGIIPIDPNDDGEVQEENQDDSNAGGGDDNRTLPPASTAATIRDERTVNGVVPGTTASTTSSNSSNTRTGQGQSNALTINPNDSGDGRIVTSPTPTIPNTPAPAPAPAPDPTPQLSTSELDTLSTSGRAGVAVTHSLAEVQSGNASDFSSSILFGNTSDNIAIRPGSATRSDFVTSIDGLEVQWGKWTSDSNNPSYWQNVAGSTSGTLSTFIMVSAPTTDTATLNKMVGNVTYNSTGNYLADKNTGSSSIQSVSSSFTVNLSATTNNITNGTLNICIGTNDCSSSSNVWEKWANTFTGTIANGKFTSTLSGNIITSSGSTDTLTGGLNIFELGSRAVEGTVTGNFTGTSGEGFVLGFRAREVGQNTNSIIGASILKTAPAITQSEINLLTHQGLAIVGPNEGAKNLGISLGKSKGLTTNSDILLYSQSPGFVLRSNGVNADSETLSTYSFDGYDVTWGKWSGTSPASEGVPLHYKYNLSNSSIYNSIIGKVIVATGTPAPASALTGSKYFESSSSNEYFITGGDEAASTIKGQFNINLGTGALTNGKLEVISSSYNWKTNVFAGTVVNGTLPTTDISGNLTVGSNTTQYAFTGEVAGQFLGSSAQAFLAAFNFKKTGASTHSFGAVLFNSVVLTPVYQSSDFSAFTNSGRFGFALSQSISGTAGLSAIGNVTVNDGAGNASYAGATERLVSANLDNILATNETPSLIIDRNNASYQNQNSAINDSNVNWGKWTSAAAKVYTNYADNRQFTTLSETSLYANFIPTTAVQFTSIGSVSRTYAGADSSSFGKVSDSLNHTYASVVEMKSVFDVNFGTGALTNGLLNLCLNAACSGSGSTEWEFAYSGTISNGILKNVTTQKASRDNTTVSLAGTIVGGFSGSTAQTFVGGYNYVEVGNTSHYLRGTFLLSPTTYLSGEEVIGLADAEYGMLATSGLLTNGIFGGQSQQKGSSNNYLFADYQLGSSGWNSATAFHQRVPDAIFRKGNAQVFTENVAGLTNLLSWGKWGGDSGSPIRRTSFNSTGSDLAQDAYWFIAVPSAPGLLTGKYASYSNVLAVQGGGSVGAISTGDISKFGFTLDLSNGAISAGHLQISTSNEYSWKVDFSGQALSKTGGFGAYAVLQTSNGSVTNNPSNFTFNGTMSGMFINSGSQAVTAFSFNNSNSTGANQHISGTLVAGKESLDVDWGSWNAPVINNWAGQLKTDAQTLFSSLQLTPEIVINRMTGTYNYTNASGATQSYGITDGAINSVNTHMKVNFDSNTIYDGSVTVNLGNVVQQEWVAGFQGTINSNGKVSLTPASTQLTIDPNVANTILPVLTNGTSSVAGAFTGATGAGFVGAFEMLDATNTSNFVRGTFQLNKGSEITAQ